jgi:hypothetical protein
MALHTRTYLWIAGAMLAVIVGVVIYVSWYNGPGQKFSRCVDANTATILATNFASTSSDIGSKMQAETTARVLCDWVAHPGS